MTRISGTGKRRGQTGYGEGEVELDLDDDVLLDESELARRLIGGFEAPGYRTLQQALVRIGIKNLRDIVVQASLEMRVFGCDAYQPLMDGLRRHAAACAPLCRIVGRYTALEAD